MMEQTFTFDAIGTHWQIDADMRGSAHTWEDVCSAVRSRIDVFDRTYSRFRPDSFVSQMAEHGESVTLLPDAKQLIDLYECLYRLTDGAFSPLVGNLLSDAGYDADYTLVPKKLRSPPTWDEAITYTYPTIQVRKGEMLDFGAAGKGYLIDLVGCVLEEMDLSSFTIDAGGDILHRSEGKRLKVGLENPLDISEVIGFVELGNLAIAGSAGNRRKWNQYHHIVDPRSQMASNSVLATWVIAESGLLSDALATCLFFVTPSTLVHDFSFSYLMIYPDQSIDRSTDFPVTLFSS